MAQKLAFQTEGQNDGKPSRKEPNHPESSGIDPGAPNRNPEQSTLAEKETESKPEIKWGRKKTQGPISS